MSSKSIYHYTPYFYIIQHTPSGKYYAGSKWSSNCTPDTLMTIEGYHTSSSKIHRLINEDGLSSFKIIQILTEAECGMSVYDYECIFLQTWDIANNKNWINKHNNTGYFDLIKYGSEEFKIYLKETYGVEYAMQLETSKILYKHNHIKKHGVEHPMQLDAIKLKTKETNLAKYGVDHPSKTLEWKLHIKDKNMTNYGVDHHMKIPEIKQKLVDTNLAIRGVDNPMKDEKVKLKFVNNFVETYGVENPFQLEEVKEKTKNTCMEKYGVEYVSQTEERRKLSSQTHLGKTIWNDGKNNYHVKQGETPDPTWKRGFLPRKPPSLEDNKANSQRQLGSKLWNDGVRNYRVKSNENPDPSWKIGKIKKSI